MINKKILILISLFLFLLLLVGCLRVPPLNHAPIINLIPLTTATVDVLYIYNVEAADPDGDTLTYTLTTSPTDMTINSATGVIKWTPSTTGDYNVTVEVSDGELFDTQSFVIIVNLSNPSCIDQPCIENKSTVVTNDVSDIERTTSTANGNITTTEGENCMVRDFQYGLSQTPTWDVFSKGLFSFITIL
ncbi:MAG: putative Ig domain-containing protein [Candidatus Atribacteria bacterium]|nr:putative Ig domain-containing protein [Candidatus Atribacteria bacterium]